MSGASKRANIGANGPVIYASISYSFYCTARRLRNFHFHHPLITELSLLSFLWLIEVTELSLLHMFFGLKLVHFLLFVCHSKSATWILFISSVQVVHVIILIAKQKTQCPLNYKWVLQPIFLKSDTSVTSIIAITQDLI